MLLLILQLFLIGNCCFFEFLFGKKKSITEAEKFLISYKEDYFWTIVANADGTHIAARACFLQYKKDFGFYICAKNYTNKYEQLKANPYVTLSFAKVKNHSIPVFYATCRVSTEKADINKAWFNGMKEYGYTGPDDPSLVVFIFTIHGAALGNTTYQGVPYAYSSLNVVGDAPLPPLPAGPYEEAEGLQVLAGAWRKDPSSFHLFTFSGLRIHDRLMRLNYNNATGFYFVTGPNTNKAAQLAGNPNVALLQEQREGNVQIVVDGLLLEVKCNTSKAGTWDDSFKAFGFTGFDDPNYAAYKLVVRKVIVHSFTAPPRVYQFEPTGYDNATQILYAAAQNNSNWTLGTVDEQDNPHSRTMLLTHHSALGFFMGGRNSSNKFKQLSYKSAASINLYVPDTGADYQVQVNTRVLNCDAVRYAIRSSRLKKINYTGPENKSQEAFQDKKTVEEFLPFVLNIKSLTYLPAKGTPPTVIKVGKTPGTGAGAAALVDVKDETNDTEVSATAALNATNATNTTATTSNATAPANAAEAAGATAQGEKKTEEDKAGEAGKPAVAETTPPPAVAAETQTEKPTEEPAGKAAAEANAKEGEGKGEDEKAVEKAEEKGSEAKEVKTVLEKEAEVKGAETKGAEEKEVKGKEAETKGEEVKEGEAKEGEVKGEESKEGEAKGANKSDL